MNRLRLLVIGLAGCAAHAPPPPAGCGCDNDCKLARVCEAGQCVWPKRCLPFPVRQPPPRPARPQFCGAACASHVSLRASAPRALTLQAARAAAGNPLDLRDWRAHHLVACAVVRRAGPVRQPRWPAVRSRSARQLRWSFATGDLIFSSPALSASGAISSGLTTTSCMHSTARTASLCGSCGRETAPRRWGWVPTPVVAMWTAGPPSGWTEPSISVATQSMP